MALISINRNPDRRTTRQFAAIWFPAFMALLGFLIFRRTHLVPVAAGFAAAGVLLGAAAFFIQPLGRALFVGASYATFPIGFAVSHVLLVVIYFGVITPIGLLLRAFGRDSMGRRREPGATTYWTKLEPGRREANDYFRQF